MTHSTKGVSFGMRLGAGLLALCCWLPLSVHAQAQTCCGLLDSLFIPIVEGVPGSGGFDFGSPELPDDRFDATGDGLADIVTIERDENGRPILATITDVKTGDGYTTFTLSDVIAQLLNEGWEPSDLQGFRFIGFINWLDPNAQFPKAVFFISKGAPVIYDPNTETTFHAPPSVVRLMWLGDLNDDGVAELVYGNKVDRIVRITSSRFAAGG